MTIDDDPISAASSGLRALGVAPQRRVETLGLLSALMDLADGRGEVTLDSDLMAAEERLGIDACLEGYEWLERLDVIRRTWSGWVIQNFEAHHGPIGMSEAAMAVLSRHLDTREDAPPLAEVAPIVPMAPVVTLKPWRRRVPVIAASVAAGVAVLAGATQLVPQAAVTTRNAASQSQSTDHKVVGVAAPTLPVTAATAAANAATTAVSNNLSESPRSDVTTTTSTTLLPALPCLGDVLRDLGGRTGLRTTQTTQNAPGILPCP